MRLLPILLAPLLLTGCFIETATYSIDPNTDHAITVRVEKDTFWAKEGTLRVIMSRLPECQRQVELGSVWLSGLQVELFGNGNNVYTLRADDQAWQIDTTDCSGHEAPDADAITGLPLGIFELGNDDKLTFEKPEAATE
ncbi:hypothetical protein SOM61_12895 [Massilia sp. CFBP9012]|uniref:hypothetical protein n=1 Tax=Massilia sp. CFBP9012 TaxID=3096531 RepID=UPI002A69D923|nr:hypothetical protein [Massilia sp. CFBP9012]MDY0975866.1 hypothetical protein [Massilia sp. CFBP9012]